MGFVSYLQDFQGATETIRRRDRERSLLQADSDVVEDWTANLPRPDAHLEVVPDSPLGEQDQAYLLQLLAAGSKAEFARRSGVSRAAVTQRWKYAGARRCRATSIANQGSVSPMATSLRPIRNGPSAPKRRSAESIRNAPIG